MYNHWFHDIIVDLNYLHLQYDWNEGENKKKMTITGKIKPKNIIKAQDVLSKFLHILLFHKLSAEIPFSDLQYNSFVHLIIIF